MTKDIWEPFALDTMQHCFWNSVKFNYKLNSFKHETNKWHKSWHAMQFAWAHTNMQCKHLRLCICPLTSSDLNLSILHVEAQGTHKLVFPWYHSSIRLALPLLQIGRSWCKRHSFALFQFFFERIYSLKLTYWNWNQTAQASTPSRPDV